MSNKIKIHSIKKPKKVGIQNDFFTQFKRAGKKVHGAKAGSHYRKVLKRASIF